MQKVVNVSNSQNANVTIVQPLPAPSCSLVTATANDTVLRYCTKLYNSNLKVVLFFGTKQIVKVSRTYAFRRGIAKWLASWATISTVVLSSEVQQVQTRRQ